MPISISKGFAANRSANMANLNFSVTEPLLSELGLVFHYGLEIYNDSFLQTAKNEMFFSLYKYGLAKIERWIKVRVATFK